MAVVIGQPAIPNSLPKETSVAPLQVMHTLYRYTCKKTFILRALYGCILLSPEAVISLVT